MLTKMAVFGSRVSVPELSLTGNGPATDPIQIRGVVGLGPVAASVNTSSFGSVDGESYLGSIVGKRNVVLTLGLNPNWADQTIASLRQLLYAYFMPKQIVTLRFFSSDLPDCEIRGYVESCEPNIFSRDPEMQVSIICPLPDFIAVESTVVTGIVNDGVIDTEIEYVGTVPTGFVLDVLASEDTPEYTGTLLIANQTPFSKTMFVTTTINETQFFRLSTVRGQKYVQNIVILGGVVTNLLRTISAETDWPQLELDSNEFSVVSEISGIGLTWSLEYFARFGGL